MVLGIGMDEHIRLEYEVAGFVVRLFENYLKNGHGYLAILAYIMYSGYGYARWLKTIAASPGYAVAVTVANLVRNIAEVVKYYDEQLYLENTYEEHGAGTSFQWWGKEYLGFYVDATRDTYMDWERRHDQSQMSFLPLLIPTSLLL